MVIKDTRQARFKRNTSIVPGYFAYYPYYKEKWQINFYVLYSREFLIVIASGSLQLSGRR